VNECGIKINDDQLWHLYGDMDTVPPFGEISWEEYSSYLMEHPGILEGKDAALPTNNRISGLTGNYLQDCWHEVQLYTADDSAGILRTQSSARRLNQEEVNTRMEVGEKLGEGQYGTVYACTYKSRDGKSIEAAAKYLTHTRFSKKEHYQVLREANQMRLVQGHANIVNFYDLLMTPKEYRMIIELIKGGELYQKICQLNEASKIRGDHQHFSEERASKIVRQIMSAVAHMHSHKLIHRDLKPENVLLVEQVDGATLIDDFHIKVADFGLAFIADDPLGKAKGEAGTPLYMAPEVLKKASKGYTAEVDVWSIGCMMHELLTGEPPFMANDKMRLKRLVLGFKGMSGNSTLDPAAKKIRADFKKDNVSATAQDLIIKLLNPKGKQRITASNAMEEPWLAKPAAL